MKLIRKILCKINLHWYIKIESYSYGLLKLDTLNKYKCSRCGVYKYEDDSFVLEGYNGVDKIDLQDYNSTVANAKNYKSYLLGRLLGSAQARQYKAKAENEKRKAERQRVQEYKEAQKAEAEKERREKLLKLKK